MTDELEIGGEKISVGKLLLSPTRTYAPLLKLLVDEYFDDINGVIHCSGGGQTKCMKYLPKPLRIVKDNLFEVAPIFKLIQENSGADNREMYQVFNMGHRLEMYVPETIAQQLIQVAASFNLDAKIIGRVEHATTKMVTLNHHQQVFQYQ